jgi:anaerobic dimethyl sulfoxide reductase subunit A
MSLGRRVKADPGAKVVRTCVPLVCGPGCGILAHVKDGVLVKVEPGDFPGTGHVCAKCLSAVKWVYHPDRLKYPMKRQGARGEGGWQRITWDEALDTIAHRLRDISDTHGSRSMAWTMDFMALLVTDALEGLIGAYGGTFLLPSGYGDSGGTCNDKVCFGAPWWYGEDYTSRFDNPALCLNWGGNPTETDSFKWRRIRDAKEGGARLVAIDPLFSTTASKADEWIPIRPGTDGALALGMMNVILDRGLQDTSFITEYTVGPFLVRTDNGMFLREKDMVSSESDKYVVWNAGTDSPVAHDLPGTMPALTGAYSVNGVNCKPAFQLLVELVQQYPPDRASDITGIPATTIIRLATEYATKKPAASFRGMGCQRTFHGDLTYHAINTLAAVTGNVSLEGHIPFEMNHLAFMSRGIPNLMPIMQMYDAIVNGKPYPIRGLWASRLNLISSMPNFNRITKELVPLLEFIVVSDMFMTASAQYADIVLPACSIYECSDVFFPLGNGSHNYVQLQQKVIEPLHESKSDLEIVASLAKRMGLSDFLTGSEEELLDLLLASGHPSMEGITVAKLKESPMLPSISSMPAFATPSGKLEFYVERLKNFKQELPYYLEPMESQRTPLAQKYPLSLLTPHPKHRLHSTFANIPWIRQLDPEPTLEMNPADARARLIQDGDIVRVFNDRGDVKLRVKLNQGVMSGLLRLEEGWWPSDFIEGTHQALTHETINPAQEAVFEPNFACHDVLVQVEPAGEVKAHG